MARKHTDRPASQAELVERYQWRRVTAPKAWRPAPGDKLTGFYVGRTLRASSFQERTQYEVVLVAVPGEGLRTITGTILIQLVDAAMLEPGAPMTVVFGGHKDTANGRAVKLFDLFVPVGVERADPSDLPRAEERV